MIAALYVYVAINWMMVIAAFCDDDFVRNLNAQFYRGLGPVGRVALILSFLAVATFFSIPMAIGAKVKS